MKQWNKDVIIIIIIGLIIRLILLPYSQTVHADAISRIIQAEIWLANPKYIISEVWGPLNQYLFGFSIKFLGGKIYGPKIINILFAVFTVYPLYWFSRNIFNNRYGAIFSASVYIISPIVIRNSFQALPAIPFAFFIALSMYYLSVYLKKENHLYVILAAFAINFAGALRYEAWIISFLFGLILLFNKGIRPFLLYGIIASIFPLSWLAGGQIIHHDWLYSFHYSTEWAINELPSMNEITSVEKMKRIMFFPYSILIVFSPLILGLILSIIPISLLKKRINKEQITWLIPFLALLIIYIYKAINGTLFLQNKYTISLLILLLPFASLLFVQTKKITKRFALLSVIMILPSSLILGKISQITIPSSFMLDKTPWIEHLGTPAAIPLAINDLFIDSYHETKIIPKLKDDKFHLIVDKSKKSHNLGEGIITDFLGWENTYYFSLHSRKTPFIISGALHDKINFDQLENYLHKHPKGLIVFNYFGRLIPFCEGGGNVIKIEKIAPKIELSLIQKTEGFLLFRYELLLSKNDTSFIKTIKTVLTFEKDVEYFSLKIKNDKHWLQSIKIQAIKERKSLEEVIRSNAQYCVDEGLD